MHDLFFFTGKIPSSVGKYNDDSNENHDQAIVPIVIKIALVNPGT